MRILLVHYDELDALGGVELLVRQLAVAFTQAGHPTAIVEMGRHWAGPRPIDGCAPLWTVTGASFPHWRRPRSWASAARSTLELRRAIRAWGADIVHVHFPIGQSIPAVGAHRLPHRWRLAVTVHNSEIRVAPRSDPRVAIWQRRLLERADAVSAVSSSMLADTRDRYPTIAGKGAVIYNGIGTSWFEDAGESGAEPDCAPERPYVLFAGRLHAMKGVDLLLRAWGEVAGARPGVELLLAGAGPERAALERIAEEPALSGRVRFLGAVENAGLKPLYRGAAAVVLPSRAEGFPLTLLEASACGAICVGADVPGIAEIIDEGETGFLFPTGSVEALTRTLGSVLDLDAARAQCIRSAAARKVKEHFTRDKMVADYLRFYAGLLGSPTVPPRGGTGDVPGS